AIGNDERSASHDQFSGAVDLPRASGTRLRKKNLACFHHPQSSAFGGFRFVLRDVEVFDILPSARFPDDPQRIFLALGGGNSLFLPHELTHASISSWGMPMFSFDSSSAFLMWFTCQEWRSTNARKASVARNNLE